MNIIDATSLVLFLVTGTIAGWLAGRLMKGHDFGIIGNMIVGIIGAFVGGYTFRFLNLSLPVPSLVASVIVATIGAIILLIILGLFAKKR